LDTWSIAVNNDDSELLSVDGREMEMSILEKAAPPGDDGPG
jgi:hypothetical protein